MAQAKTKAAPAPEPVKKEEPVAEATASENKSIIDPKYRLKYKNRKEWMADLLKEHGSITKTHPAVAAVGKEGEVGYKPAKEERTTVEGVDVDALFKIARENGLNVDKYDTQREGHGFPGRFRMTVGNMLRAIAKARHGVKIDGEFVDAPEEWLTANGAPAEPTHDQEGVKIGKAAAEKAPEPESKLIKKEPAAASASPAGKKK